MAGIIENKDGQIAIDLRVVEEYAGHATMDCFGIVGMSAINVRDGVAKLLKGDSLRRGVTVQMDEAGDLIITFHRYEGESDQCICGRSTRDRLMRGHDTDQEEAES